MDVVEREQLTADQAFDHWYYRAKFQLLLERLRPLSWQQPNQRIADVGCGMGLFMTFLEKTGHARAEQLIGIDPAYTEPGTALGGKARILPKWPAGEEVRLALLMDVLEHTPDDRAVLREATDHVEEGGYVFITVPAFSWLFSAHDRFLGHYRRYSIQSLGRLIEATGDLEVQELHYYYASIFPAAVPWRLARRSGRGAPCSDLKKLPKWLNRLLRLATQAEIRLARLNRFAGLSVVALCRKTSARSEVNAAPSTPETAVSPDPSFAAA